MSYRLVFRPGTEIDAQVARDWYENQRAGLGAEFHDRMIACLEEILAAPLQQRASTAVCDGGSSSDFPT
jgi:hypothetical protein